MNDSLRIRESHVRREEGEGRGGEAERADLGDWQPPHEAHRGAPEAGRRGAQLAKGEAGQTPLAEQDFRQVCLLVSYCTCTLYSYYTSISYSYIIRVLLLYLSFIASTIVLYIAVAIHFFNYMYIIQ